MTTRGSVFIIIFVSSRRRIVQRPCGHKQAVIRCPHDVYPRQTRRQSVAKKTTHADDGRDLHRHFPDQLMVGKDLYFRERLRSGSDPASYRGTPETIPAL